MENGMKTKALKYLESLVTDETPKSECDLVAYCKKCVRAYTDPEKKKEEFNFEANSKAKNEVGSLEIPEINFDTMSIDIDKILEDAMKTMEIAGIRLDVV